MDIKFVNPNNIINKWIKCIAAPCNQNKIDLRDLPPLYFSRTPAEESIPLFPVYLTIGDYYKVVSVLYEPQDNSISGFFITNDKIPAYYSSLEQFYTIFDIQNLYDNVP